VKTLLNASIVVLTLLLFGCTSGADNSGGQPIEDTGGNSNNDGGSTSNSPGNDTGGSSTGDSGTGGSNSGGDSGSTGGDTGGGGSSGGTNPGFGSLSSLYSTQNERVNVHNCNMVLMEPNAAVSFAEVVFRLISQSGNDVNAIVTLTTPDSQFLPQFDQVLLGLNGTFDSNGIVSGSYSVLSTLNGQAVDRTEGLFTIEIFQNTTLLITLDVDANFDTQNCHITGSMYLNETADPGTGSGGNTGGGTGSGGDTGGGTGGNSGSAAAGSVTATGQFGSLQMQSQEFPEDDGTFDMTTVLFVNSPGNEILGWTNDQEATVNIYLGLDRSNTTYNSTNRRSYSCDCFPAVDLINNQVIFSNLVLLKGSSPTGSITVNGTLTFPQVIQ